MAHPRISSLAGVLSVAVLAAGPPVWATMSAGASTYPDTRAGALYGAAEQRDIGVRPIMLANGSVSMDQAVKMAEQRFKARVVRAESQQNGGHTLYVLRMLNESGRVWTVRVDASNGAVL